MSKHSQRNRPGDNKPAEKPNVQAGAEIDPSAPVDFSNHEGDGVSDDDDDGDDGDGEFDPASRPTDEEIAGVKSEAEPIRAGEGAAANVTTALDSQVAGALPTDVVLQIASDIANKAKTSRLETVDELIGFHTFIVDRINRGAAAA